MREAPAALGVTAVHRLGLAALAAALAFFTFECDLALAATGINIRWDPEIFYMMNSLLPFVGRGYTFIDHPGTPVEVIGTVLLALLWPAAAARSESISEFAIGRPWIFLAFAHLLLTGASIAVAFLLALRTMAIRRWDDVLLSLAAACSYFAVHGHALESLVYWSHNSFNFPAGGLLGVLLFLRLREGRVPGRRWLTGAGMAAGALAAVQLYMGAWIVTMAVAVAATAVLGGHGWRHGLRAAVTVGAASVAGFIVATLPIAARYPDFFRWVAALAFRQGLYGSGTEGFSLGVLAANGVAIVNQHRRVFLALLFLLLAIAMAAVRDRRALREHAGAFAVALGLAVQALLLTLAIFKHPGSLYVLSLGTLVPLLTVVASSCWRARGGWPARAAFALFASVWIVGFVHMYPANLGLHRMQPTTALQGLERAELALRQGSASPAGAPELRIWTVGTDAPCFALWLANVNAGRAFSTEIARRCPRDGMAWWDYVEYPQAWRPRIAESPSAVLVTVEGELATEPWLRWGTPVATDVQSLYMGRYLIVPFEPARLLAPVRR